MKAVDKFEYRRGYKFSDLRDVVDSAGDHPLDRRPGTHHPIPVHMIETINKLNRFRARSSRSRAGSRLPRSLPSAWKCRRTRFAACSRSRRSRSR